jgi:hypothetical protein
MLHWVATLTAVAKDRPAPNVGRCGDRFSAVVFFGHLLLAAPLHDAATLTAAGDVPQ